MPKFIKSEIIQKAVGNLADSSARSGFVDFLVFKRSLNRAQGIEIPFSSTDQNFTGAMKDLAASFPLMPGLEIRDGVKPFVKIFGTGQTEKYVSHKWISNGPADTLSGPKWENVVEVNGANPRKGRLKTGYLQHLHALTIKARGDLPNIYDASIWYHRAADIESVINNTQDIKAALGAVKNSFTAALGLTQPELAILFKDDTSHYESLTVSDLVSETCAPPLNYLPDLTSATGEVGSIETLVQEFLKSCSKADVGLRVEPGFALRMFSALSAKRLLILAGLSGSGKTKLAQAVAKWLSPTTTADNNRSYSIIPVGADWTSSDAIIGYPDGLAANRWVAQPALDLILRAAQKPDVPHFLILDEMNLSHVERYFSAILSLVESNEAMELYTPEKNPEGQHILRSGISPELELPNNLFIIGTINVDETTYMFSPKVLDRANVMEFALNRDDVIQFFQNPIALNLENLEGDGQHFGAAFVSECRKDVIMPQDFVDKFKDESLMLFDIFKAHQAEFGFRVLNETSRFMYYYRLYSGIKPGDTTDGAWFDSAIDAIIIQKLLPKLHGSRTKLEGLLWAVSYACGANRGTLSAAEFTKACLAAGTTNDEAKYSPHAVKKALGDGKARYPLSFDKVQRMYAKLIRDQFVTFSEA